jgi:hypothetical protein
MHHVCGNLKLKTEAYGPKEEKIISGGQVNKKAPHNGKAQKIQGQ